MALRLQRFSYRFAEEVLNSKLALKQEIETVLLDPGIDIPSLSRPNFNRILEERFVAKDGTANHLFSMNPVTPLQKWTS